MANLSSNNPHLQTIEQLAALGNGFTIPWPGTDSSISLFESFHSDLAMSSPPFSAPAFDYRSIEATEIRTYTSPDSGSGTFSETSSTDTRSGSDHLSASLGVTAGWSFLNASVSGNYDKAVLENSDSNKVSRRSAFVGPIISCKHSPALSRDALDILRRDGVAGFRRRFGDFFVKGFQLGAECGMMLSQRNSKHGEREAMNVKTSVKVWFATITKTLAESTATQQTENSSISLTAYDTLNNLSTTSSDTGGILQYSGWMQSLQERFVERITPLLEGNVAGGRKIREDHYRRLARENLITGVILAPFTTLSDYNYVVYGELDRTRVPE